MSSTSVLRNGEEKITKLLHAAAAEITGPYNEEREKREEDVDYSKRKLGSLKRLREIFFTLHSEAAGLEGYWQSQAEAAAAKKLLASKTQTKTGNPLLDFTMSSASASSQRRESSVEPARVHHDPHLTSDTTMEDYAEEIKMRKIKELQKNTPKKKVEKTEKELEKQFKEDKKNEREEEKTGRDIKMKGMNGKEPEDEDADVPDKYDSQDSMIDDGPIRRKDKKKDKHAKENGKEYKKGSKRHVSSSESEPDDEEVYAKVGAAKEREKDKQIVAKRVQKGESYLQDAEDEVERRMTKSEEKKDKLRRLKLKKKGKETESDLESDEDNKKKNKKTKGHGNISEAESASDDEEAMEEKERRDAEDSGNDSSESGNESDYTRRQKEKKKIKSLHEDEVEEQESGDETQDRDAGTTENNSGDEGEQDEDDTRSETKEGGKKRKLPNAPPIKNSFKSKSEAEQLAIVSYILGVTCLGKMVKKFIPGNQNVATSLTYNAMVFLDPREKNRLLRFATEMVQYGWLDITQFGSMRKNIATAVAEIFGAKPYAKFAASLDLPSQEKANLEKDDVPWCLFFLENPWAFMCTLKTSMEHNTNLMVHKDWIKENGGRRKVGWWADIVNNDGVSTIDVALDTPFGVAGNDYVVVSPEIQNSMQLYYTMRTTVKKLKTRLISDPEGKPCALEVRKELAQAEAFEQVLRFDPATGAHFHLYALPFPILIAKKDATGGTSPLTIPKEEKIITGARKANRTTTAPPSGNETKPVQAAPPAKVIPIAAAPPPAKEDVRADSPDLIMRPSAAAVVTTASSSSSKRKVEQDSQEDAQDRKKKKKDKKERYEMSDEVPDNNSDDDRASVKSNDSIPQTPAKSKKKPAFDILEFAQSQKNVTVELSDEEDELDQRLAKKQPNLSLTAHGKRPPPTFQEKDTPVSQKKAAQEEALKKAAKKLERSDEKSKSSSRRQTEDSKEWSSMQGSDNEQH